MQSADLRHMWLDFSLACASTRRRAAVDPLEADPPDEAGCRCRSLTGRTRSGTDKGNSGMLTDA